MREECKKVRTDPITITTGVVAIVTPPAGGVILYEVIDTRVVSIAALALAVYFATYVSTSLKADVAASFLTKGLPVAI